jgi:hypothetical protein
MQKGIIIIVLVLLVLGGMWFVASRNNSNLEEEVIISDDEFEGSILDDASPESENDLFDTNGFEDIEAE